MVFILFNSNYILKNPKIHNLNKSIRFKGKMREVIILLTTVL